MQRLRYPSVSPVFTPSAVPRVKRPAKQPLRTGTPFFRDPAHTIPTKWSLYRPLLRALGGCTALRSLGQRQDDSQQASKIPRASIAPPPAAEPSQDDVLPALRARWRRRKGQTSIPRTKSYLELEERLLSALENTSNTADLLQFRQTANAELSRYHEPPSPPPPRTQPLLTGAFLRPSILNGPLPRMKPQPIHISMMMKNRVKQRAARIAKHKELQDLHNGMRREANFWKDLGIDDWGGRPGPSWSPPLSDQIRDLEQSFHRDQVRASSVFPKPLMEKIMAARRRRHAFFDQRGKERREARERPREAAEGKEAAKPSSPKK